MYKRQHTDGARDLLRTFDEVGGVNEWADRIGNRKPTSTGPNAPLKAAAVQSAAAVLADLGITTTAELAAADRTAAAQSWLAIPGQRSGLTWSCLLTLAGIKEARADRMVIRYVANALEVEPMSLTADDVGDLVEAAAHDAGVDPAALDHAIWRFETRRHVV